MSKRTKKKPSSNQCTRGKYSTKQKNGANTNHKKQKYVINDYSNVHTPCASTTSISHITAKKYNNINNLIDTSAWYSILINMYTTCQQQTKCSGWVTQQYYNETKEKENQETCSKQTIQFEHCSKQTTKLVKTETIKTDRNLNWNLRLQIRINFTSILNLIMFIVVDIRATCPCQTWHFDPVQYENCEDVLYSANDIWSWIVMW